MLRKLELFNRCQCRRPQLRGRSVLVDCSEVLKVCSSGALARSRNFLEFRMIEARMGLESQKGHLFEQFRRAQRDCRACGAIYVILKSLSSPTHPLPHR